MSADIDWPADEPATDDPGTDDADVSSDGPAFSVVNCVALADRAPLMELLGQRGFVVLPLDGTGVHDKSTFLAQAQVDLPPVADLAPGNWDALADYLRNVLLDLGQEQVALVWTDADRIVGGDLQDLLDALSVITGVAHEAYRWTPRATTLLTFLVGGGPQFRRLGETSTQA